MELNKKEAGILSDIYTGLNSLNNLIEEIRPGGGFVPSDPDDKDIKCNNVCCFNFDIKYETNCYHCANNEEILNCGARKNYITISERK